MLLFFFCFFCSRPLDTTKDIKQQLLLRAAEKVGVQTDSGPSARTSNIPCGFQPINDGGDNALCLLGISSL